jgi:hypothetical protein
VTPPRRSVLFPLMAGALVALLAALWAGLVRIGWPWPPLVSTLPALHGPLMVSGFLGTVIALERASAIRRPWAFVAPALTALGGLALLFGVGGRWGPALFTSGGVVLILAYAVILSRQPSLFGGTMALGAFMWALGSALWFSGWAVPVVVMWWAGFLVLTVAGERFELGRVMRPPLIARRLFRLAVYVIVIGLAVTLLDGGVAGRWHDLGARVCGAGLVALAAWLARYDVARITVRQTGLARFVAICLLTGYAWLAAGGLLTMVYGGVLAGPSYDALLHAVFVGFVLSMIFGHAPIVMPALLGRLPVYHPGLYGHVALVHASLALRVIGDLAGWPTLRQWGGLLNAVALLVFIAATAVVVGRRMGEPDLGPVGGAGTGGSLTGG